MVLRIELENLWRRLAVRFKAHAKSDTDPNDPAYPILLETLQPVTNFDDLLKTATISRITVERTAVAGAGYATGNTPIPAGKRWQILAISVLRASGDGTLSQFRVLDGTRSCVIYAVTATATPNTEMLSQPVPMEEGWDIQAYVAAITGDTVWTFDFLHYEEDAY